jgi:putative glutathione S-transferase
MPPVKFDISEDIGSDGSFQRKPSVFRDWIKADGSTRYLPEKNRYHLYVSYACPWANRCLIVRNLKGLQDVIGVTVVDWLIENRAEGWRFGFEGEKEPLFPYENITHLKQIYEKTVPGFEGRITVPVLFDKKTGRIVNNESAEIIRMFNSEFNELAKNTDLDLYPLHLRKEIDELNEWVANTVNNGVYKCGFAVKQEPYEEACRELFDSLEKLDRILDGHRYLFTDDFITEADVRLFTTLVRFDTVYHGHFKCNLKKLTEFRNLYDYTRDIYQIPGIKETVNMRHIKYCYYMSHDSINPTRIVPLFEEKFDGEHGRDKKFVNKK